MLPGPRRLLSLPNETEVVFERDRIGDAEHRAHARLLHLEVGERESRRGGAGDPLAAILTRRAREIVVGSGRDPKSEMGPVVTAAARDRIENLIGTIHYVDRAGKTTLLDDGLAFPNGIVLTPDGKTLYVSNEEDAEIGIVDVASGKRTGAINWVSLPMNAPSLIRAPRALQFPRSATGRYGGRL